MTTQVTIICDWRETNRGERSFGFDHLMRRYEEIGVDVAAQLDRIVQPAGDCRPPEKNAVDRAERECPNDFSRGCVDHERLRSAPLCCINRRD
jgi:hypothetical protein